MFRERAVARCGWLALLVVASMAFAQSARLVLRWKDVPGAQGYELQIAKDAAFVEVVLQTRAPTAAYRWEQLPSETHWWRVRSFDAEGRASEWSQPRTVSLDSTVPVPKFPADDAALPCGQGVELVFEGSALVREFLVEVSSSKDFTPARQLTSKIPTVALGPLAPGTWYWRAKAIDVRGRTGEAMGTRRFSIRPGIPKAKQASDVVLGAPSVNLSWSEVPCASSFVIEASTDGKEKVELSSPSASLVFKPNAAGEYRWRVAAVDEKGTPGDWSAESSFKVRLATPQPKSENATPAKVDLVFGAVVGASSYKVELSAERDFSRLVASGIVTGTQFRATEVPTGRHFWRVTARDDKGHSSFPSEARTVEVEAGEPLAAPSFFNPEADVVVSANTPVGLEWRAVKDASYYELEVDGEVSPVAASPRVLNDLAEGAHVLRLRAKGNARVSPWSEPREVYVGIPPVRRAEVVVVGDSLRVVLKDGKGRPVENVTPTLSVRSGAIGPPTFTNGAFAAAWSPPADGEDVLRIEERDFVSEVPIERKLPTLFSVAGRAGGLFNFSSVASPTVTLGLTARLPVLGRRLGLEARVGVYAASTTATFGAQGVTAQVWVVPVSLLAGWHQPIGAFTLHAGIGPAFQVATVSVGNSSETRVVGDFEMAVGLGRALGPGALEVEVSGLFGALDGQLARLSTSGLGLRVGYSFDLGGRR